MAVKASATITLSFMVDVKAVYRYYKLQASTASAPSAPITTPASTPSGWTAAEPTYTEGSTNTLYFVDGTLFANDTFSYSAVSKSSAYEAAKAAYNKAVTANNTANSAKDAVDNLEIGGRNYIFDSDNFTSGGSTASGITTSVENGLWTIVTTSGNGNWNSWSKSNAIEDNFQTGDAFTFSIEIKCDEGSTGKPCIYFKSGMGYYDMQGSVSTEYSTLYYTGTWNDTNDIAFHLGWQSTVGTFYIRRVKFEKGDKPTDWSPAPEDMATNEDLNDTINDVYDINESIENIGNDISDLNDNLNEVGDKTDQLDATVTAKIAEWDYDKEQTTLTIEGVKETADDLKEKIEARFRFGMDENGNALIGLGSSDSAFTADFTNEELSFSENKVKVAWINGHTLFIDAAEIKNAKIEQDLSFGGFAFMNRSNGHLTLKWVGDN